MTLTIGEILQNRYRIDALLGQGGMGAVYRAYDLTLSRVCAVKEMAPPPGLSRDERDQLDRQFRQEASVLANLSHPNLPRVSDHFQWRRAGILVMDYVEGSSLEAIINQQGALPEAQVLDWAGHLLDALGYCHSQNVLHRDIKPQNIIITPHGRAMLVDFGLVKLWNPADPGTMTVVRGMGTPAYAPPEQYGTGTGHTEARSDIYSLGATLYHALTGKEPLAAGQRTSDPRSFVPPRALRRALSLKTEAAVLKAMELDKSQRYPSAEAMASALAAAPVPLAPAAAPVYSTPVAAPVRQRNPLSWVLAIVAAAILALGAAYLLTHLQATPTPATVSAMATVGAATAEPALLVTLPLASMPTEPPQATPLPPTESPPATPLPPPTALPTRSGPIVPGPALIQPTSGDGKEGYPSYSPDGRYVVYTSERDGTWQIYMMNADGSEPRRLTTNDADNWGPCFSPDGREIAYTSRADGDSDIYVTDLNGQVLRQLTNEPEDQQHPNWSPDGESIAYAGWIGDNYEIFIIDASGGDPSNVTNHPAYDSYPAFAPDGQHLVFTSDRDGNWEIYRLELSSGAVRRLTNDSARDADPSVSPDGQWIAFASDRSGNYDLWVMDWNGGNLRQLTESLANDWVPAFAPDGSGVIFYQSDDSTGETHIYVVPFRP